MAEKVQLVLRGEKADPTVIVKDQGIGIHPNNFKATIVELGQSDKGQRPYLVGMYGQGGSSTFDKCDYTIIVSRRHPNFREEGQSDEVGWTIVRRKLETRAHVYSFLVDPETGEVPRFEGEIGDAIELYHGTWIAHVGYHGLQGFSNQLITNHAFYTLNFRLDDPLLPWKLGDERAVMRYPTPGARRRTMRGIPYRLGLHPQVSGVGSLEARRRGEETAVRHHISYSHNTGSGSRLHVEWWVVQDERVIDGRRRREHRARGEPYRDRTRRYAQRPITITRGGQMHSTLTGQLFRGRFPEIARSIVVNVDTDDLTFEEGASFFSSTRADLKAASQDLVEQAIRAAIELYEDELREIERERQAEVVAGRSASDEDVIRERLDPLIRAFQSSRTEDGRGASKVRQRVERFRGVEIPTYLKFARNDPLLVYPGVPTHVDLLTDAADKVVRDQHTRFQLRPSSDLIRVAGFQGGSGRWHVRLEPSAELPIGARVNITAMMGRDGIWWREAENSCDVIAQAAPPPYEGTNPPTFVRIRAHGGVAHIGQGGGRITVESDVRDDFLERGGTFDVAAPPGFAVGGLAAPRKGEFRIPLSVPADRAPGRAGQIAVRLTLPNGIQLTDNADLLVIAAPKRGGTTDVVSAPRYYIHDVREMPVADGDKAWSEMAELFESDRAWSAGDVGGYYVTSGDERAIHFYLNVDNGPLRVTERHVARRHSDAGLDALRQYQRTLVCYYLYQLAVADLDQTGTGEQRGYDVYREELMRVNHTLLFAQQEFVSARGLEAVLVDA